MALTTKLIKQDVYAGVVRERMENVMKITQLSKVCGDLKGVKGDTVNFPVFKRGGKPKVIAKGGEITTEEIEQESTSAKIVHYGIGKMVYDIDDEIALGDRIEESAKQIGEAFAEQQDLDLVKEALKSELALSIADTREITFADINTALSLLEDRQELSSFAGIVIHSLSYPALLEMKGFVDGTLTYTTNRLCKT